MWKLHAPIQKTSKQAYTDIHISPRMKQNAIKQFINMDQKNTKQGSKVNVITSAERIIQQ